MIIVWKKEKKGGRSNAEIQSACNPDQKSQKDNLLANMGACFIGVLNVECRILNVEFRSLGSLAI
jgi:hypothetical protein